MITVRLFVLGLVVGTLYLQSRSEIASAPAAVLLLVMTSLTFATVGLMLARLRPVPGLPTPRQTGNTSPLTVRLAIGSAWFVAGAALGTGYGVRLTGYSASRC